MSLKCDRLRNSWCTKPYTIFSKYPEQEFAFFEIFNAVLMGCCVQCYYFYPFRSFTNQWPLFNNISYNLKSYFIIITYVKIILFISINFLLILPVSSEPPVLAGGDQLRVTLLLVIFSTWKLSGHDGGALINKIY